MNDDLVQRVSEGVKFVKVITIIISILLLFIAIGT